MSAALPQGRVFFACEIAFQQGDEITLSALHPAGFPFKRASSSSSAGFARIAAAAAAPKAPVSRKRAAAEPPAAAPAQRRAKPSPPPPPRAETTPPPAPPAAAPALLPPALPRTEPFSCALEDFEEVEFRLEDFEIPGGETANNNGS